MQAKFYLRSTIFLAIWCCHCTHAQASVVSSYTLSAGTFARIGPDSDQDSQPAGANSGSLQSSTSNGTGISNSQVTWNWSNETLTSTSTFLADRTAPSGPPVQFENTGLLRLQFTLSQAASYSLNGTWGFVDIGDGDDSIAVRLLDSGGGVLFSDAHNTPDTGSFLSSGTLQAGDYTFELETIMTERLQSRSTNSALWDLARFDLNPVTSTPEPATGGATILILLFCALHRQRRNAAA